MDLDIVPIIPDEPKVRREPYNLALTKLIRDNEHKIISSYVRYQGSSIHIEIELKSDGEIVDILQSMSELKIKEDIKPPDDKGIPGSVWEDAQRFVDYVRARSEQEQRYDGDSF